MFEVNLKIISELQSFLHLIGADRQLLKRFSLSNTDFTRSRKLPFERVAILIVKLCKKTLSFEIGSFFEDIGNTVPCSVSAFCQQRMKLSPLFFNYWNKVLVDSYYHYSGSAIKRWKQYRVIAADGSNISLINKDALRDYFGGQSNQSSFFVQAKTFYHYDVLNELIVAADIKPYRYGEMKMAHQAINDIESDMLTIYDRNFSNYKMIALHLWQETERKFIIRANEQHNWIKRFIATGDQNAQVTIYPTASMIEGLRKSGFVVIKETGISVRLVRIELEKNPIILITNLWEEEGHALDEFKELYHMRWSIETNIGTQKNILQLESFSGLSAEAVLQDFYATILVTNLHSVLIKDAQQTVQQTMKDRKYPVKINKNKSFGKLKQNIVKLFVNQSVEHILLTLHCQFIRDVIPIRKGRSFPRIMKNKQTKSKFKTFTNFKPAY